MTKIAGVLQLTHSLYSLTRLYSRARALTVGAIIKRSEISLLSCAARFEQTPLLHLSSSTLSASIYTQEGRVNYTHTHPTRKYIK